MYVKSIISHSRIEFRKPYKIVFLQFLLKSAKLKNIISVLNVHNTIIRNRYYKKIIFAILNVCESFVNSIMAINRNSIFIVRLLWDRVVFALQVRFFFYFRAKT